MLNEHSVDLLEKRIKDLEDIDTAIVSKKKGITYPFVYLTEITRVEIDIYTKYIRENPGETPLMIKVDSGFSKLGYTTLDLNLVLLLSKFGAKDIYIKLDKDKSIPIEEILPHLILQNVKK